MRMIAYERTCSSHHMKKESLFKFVHPYLKAPTKVIQITFFVIVVTNKLTYANKTISNCLLYKYLGQKVSVTIIIASTILTNILQRGLAWHTKKSVGKNQITGSFASNCFCSMTSLFTFSEMTYAHQLFISIVKTKSHRH